MKPRHRPFSSPSARPPPQPRASALLLSISCVRSWAHSSTCPRPRVRLLGPLPRLRAYRAPASRRQLAAVTFAIGECRRPGPGSPPPPFGTVVRPMNRSPVAASRSISLPPSKNANAASPPPHGHISTRPLPDEDAPTAARVTAREARGALGVDSTSLSALAGSFVAWRRLDDVGSGCVANRRRNAPCTPHPSPLPLPSVGRPRRWLPATSPDRCPPPPPMTPPRGECARRLAPSSTLRLGTGIFNPAAPSISTLLAPSSPTSSLALRQGVAITKHWFERSRRRHPHNPIWAWLCTCLAL
jgi:hypothetical protein